MSVSDEIADVERRIELRRQLAALHFDEARREASAVAAKAASWLPLVAVAGSLAVGFAASRMHARGSAPAPKSAPVVRGAQSRGLLATLLGIAATAMRIGASAEARMFWNALTAFRARRSARSY